MAGYTTNPGLAETLGGLAKTFMGDPSARMKAAQLRAQAGKFNQDRLASIQTMEIEKAAEVERVAGVEALKRSQKSLGDAFKINPGDHEKWDVDARPSHGFVGPMGATEDTYTQPEIDNKLAGILSGMSGDKDAHAAAINTLQAQQALGFGDRAQRVVGLGNPGTTAALDSLSQRRETDNLDDSRGNTHELNKLRVAAGLKPLKAGDILTGPLAKATDMTQDQVNVEGDRQSELKAQVALRLEARKGIQTRMTNAQKYYNERIANLQKNGFEVEAKKVENEAADAMARLQAQLDATYKPLVPGEVQTGPTRQLTGIPQVDLQAIDDNNKNRDTDNTIRINNEKPLTGNDVLNWVGPDGRGGTSVDGKTDLVSGSPLPADSRVFKATTNGTVGDATNIGTPTQQGRRTQQLASLTSLEEMVGAEIAKIEKNPTIVGTSGIIQNFSQGLLDSLSGLGGVKRSTEDIIADVAVNENFSPELRSQLSASFNDDLASMNTRFDMMAYLAAESIAGQAGRGLSDKDFNNFRRALGDPRSFFTGAKTVTARLKSFQNMIVRKRKELRSLGGSSPREENHLGTYNPDTGEFDQ